MLDYLSDGLSEVSKKIRLGTLRNEAEVRSEIMKILRTLMERPEFHGVAIREEEKLINGRPDARIGGLVIEFESPWDAKGHLRETVTAKKIDQATGYMQTFQAKGQTVRGVVTNGVELVLIDEDLHIADRGPL